MKEFWSENSHELYKRACIMLNYPGVPFGKFLKEIINKDDIVADIGCGFGIWPDIDIGVCDVTVGFYHHEFARTEEKIKKLLSITKRAGIVICQGPAKRESNNCVLVLQK